jgi:D-cysteine desulfhydrase
MVQVDSIKFPPCLGYTQRDTPLTFLKSIQNEIPDYKVWIKRDDLTGSELSGNKVRKLDFLVHDALKQKKTHLITCGGVQSNHCRAAAFMAVKNGLKPILYLRGTMPEIATGNLLMNQLVGAEIHYITPEMYQNVDEIMEEKAHSVREGYVIPEGGSNAIGAWGYIVCFREILNQLPLYKLKPDAIWVATGSGGTHAGLLLGKYIFNSSIEIISVNVCNDAQFFKAKIKSIIDDFQRINSLNLRITEEDIHIVDGFVGEGYALITDAEIQLIQKIARNEGIILDPVYTSKAFLGLLAQMREHKINYKKNLFIHTGGIFSIFAHAAMLQNA